MEKVKEQYSMPRCDIEKLKDEIRKLKKVLKDCKKIFEEMKKSPIVAFDKNEAIILVEKIERVLK